MSDVDPNEMIYITHPEVEAVGGPVPRHAFDSLWSGKGWTEASTEQASAAAAGEEYAPATTSTRRRPSEGGES